MLIQNSCLKEKWKFECDAPIISVAATPNCSLICVATVGRSIYVFDPDGEDVWKKYGRSGEGELDDEAWSAAISADGSVLAVGTANKNPARGTVHIFDLTGEKITAQSLDSPVWSLSFSADGNYLAASCWNGNAYKFKKHNSTYKIVAVYESKNRKGLYGITLNRNGSQAFVCSYDQGIVVLDNDWKKERIYECSKGSYNIAFAPGSQSLYVGLRRGEILKANLKDEVATTIKIPDCDRPVCGVSTSDHGDIVACGSFDGWFYLTTDDGNILGSAETLGEVWSVSCSEDGSKICVGSGDHTIRFLENTCSEPVVRELKDFESACSKEDVPGPMLERLVAFYSKHGIYQYGYQQLARLGTAQPTSARRDFQEKRQELLERAVTFSGNNEWACYELGLIEQERGNHRDAVRHFQQAANNPSYNVMAMHRCAESFHATGLETAVTSCYRRARQQPLNNDAKKLLYHLGQSYEDSGQFAGAFKHYQFLASWDSGYRNIWDRLETVQRAVKSDGDSKMDYAGLTTSLLGKDAPQVVDRLLSEVLEARTSEILVKSNERERVSRIIAELRSNEKFSRGIARKGLDYDQELFLKYDFALPEDEIKKFLETVNLFYLLGDFDLNGKYTLDIGSATGRYPTLFRGKGAKSFGIDLSEAAIKYANEQREEGSDFPKYFRANASEKFPEGIPRVNLVTCMMGTFAHIPTHDQPRVLEQIYNNLEAGGFAAISTWDMECSHLSYLSIYDEKQKDDIRKNSPSCDAIRQMMLDAGFAKVEIRPFALLPEIIIYDLGLEEMGILDIELSAQADLAVRSLYPSKHGEMFIAFGKK